MMNICSNNDNMTYKTIPTADTAFDREIGKAYKSQITTVDVHRVDTAVNKDFGSNISQVKYILVSMVMMHCKVDIDVDICFERKCVCICVSISNMFGSNTFNFYH